MRAYPIVVLAAALAASPAAATGGLSCTPVGGAGPRIDLAAGHTVAPAILGVTLRERGRVLSAGPINQAGKHPLAIGQAWYHAEEVRLDLLDARHTRFEAKLRVRFGKGRRSHIASGSLIRNGRTYPVRCVGE